jgi:hypothetical protein
MLSSFDLENNHKNLYEEEEEDNPFDYFLQLAAWLPSYYKSLSYNTAGNIMPFMFGRDIQNIAFRSN